MRPPLAEIEQERTRKPGKAIERLDKAVANKDSGLTETAIQNLFDKILFDPRRRPFLRKLGKSPEQLAKIEFKVTLPQ